LCSLILPRHNTDGASYDARTLGHADEPETCAPLHAVRGVEAPTIIRDHDLGLVTYLEQPHISATGAGVCNDVPKGFLRDSVGAKRSVRRDGSEISLRRARHRQTVCTPEFAAVRRQALDETQMLQHGRMEIVRKLANVACELERLLLKLHELLSQLLTDVVLA